MNPAITLTLPLKTLLLGAAVCTAFVSLPVDAQHGHRGHGHGRGPSVSIGLHFGSPHSVPYRHHWRGPPRVVYSQPYIGFGFGYPYAYPYAYRHYAPVIVAPAIVSPPVYIEQPQRQPEPSSPPQAQPQGGNWWYYCRDAQGYHPYVRECPGGWERVTPQPPSG